MNNQEESKLFTSVEIEINTSCNRRCSYCPNSIFDRGLIQNEHLMPEELFYKIIDELAEIDYSGRISPHFYGEPLLDARLTDFIRYTKKKIPKAHIVIVTNGDYLDYKKYNELIHAGVTAFSVTQHGPKMSDAMNDLFSHFKYLKQLPIPIYYQVIDRATPLYNRGGLISVSILHSHPDCILKNCSVINIDYNGNVVLCCNDYLSSVTFGNVRQEKLLDIWGRDTYRDVREQLMKMNFKLPICLKCIENLDPIQIKDDVLRIWIDQLKVPNESSFLYDPIDIVAITEISEGTEFSVEVIKNIKINKMQLPLIWISGWAIDSSHNKPASAVFITFDTGQEFRAYYSLERPDVSAHFGLNDVRYSGFVALIPLDRLPLGTKSFHLKIVNHDKSGVFIPKKIFSVNISEIESAKNDLYKPQIIRKQEKLSVSILDDIQRPENNRSVVGGLLDFIRIQRPLTSILGPQFRPNSHKIEIDITYTCNLRCFNCNRSCGLAPSNEYMTISQIKRFLNESREAGRFWGTIRLLGGEPTLHPEFFEILDLLCTYKKTHSPLTIIEVASNGFGQKVNNIISQIPEGIKLINTKKIGIQNLNFNSFNIAPMDRIEYGFVDYTNACWVTDICGMGLTPFGYYPCAVGGGIDRVFGFDLGLKQLPTENEQFTESLEILCRRCGMFKRLTEPPLNRPLISAVWKEAYATHQKKSPSLTRY